MEKKDGVTLMVLVITVIVLLIIAGISLVAILNDNGILSNTEKSKVRAEEENIRDDLSAAWSGLETEYLSALGSNALASEEDFFNEDKLNDRLSGKGKISNLKYSEDKSSFEYVPEGSKKTYSVVVEGGIVNFVDKVDKVENVEGVYARIYGTKGNLTLEFTNSNNFQKIEDLSQISFIKEYGNIGKSVGRFEKISNLSYYYENYEKFFR